MKTKSIWLTCMIMHGFFFQLSAQQYKVYICDAGNFNQPPWQILMFDSEGDNGTVFIDDHLAWPQDIFFLESEKVVLISNLNSGKISRFHATTGDYIDDFATGISGPTRMKLGNDGFLYVLQWQGNGEVLRYSLDGTSQGPFSPVGVSSAIGLDWDSDGNLYVSSFYGKYVKKFSPEGEDLGYFINSNLAGPTNIWFDENGDLLVIDYNGNAIKRFDSNGNYLGVFIAGLPQGEGIDFTPDGNIVVGSGGTASVRVYSPGGQFIQDLIPPGTLGLMIPNAVVFREVAASPVKDVYVDRIFVTPTAGVHFQVENPGTKETEASFQVYNAGGIFIRKVYFSDSTYWDASNLTDGLYYITTKLEDGKIARQQVVVRK